MLVLLYKYTPPGVRRKKKRMEMTLLVLALCLKKGDAVY